MSVQQPPWSPLKGSAKILFSKSTILSQNQKSTEFVPRDARRVKWYNCGPTVYDANYVTQDILRRIMTDFFGYDVHFVMNVTDIDDKIIKRARFKNHLLEKFREETKGVSPELITQVHAAWRNHVREQLRKGLPVADAPKEGDEDSACPRLAELIQNKDWKQECLRRDETLEVARAQLSTGNRSQEAAHTLIADSKDILSQALDDQYKLTVTDPSISRSLAAYWENQIFEDMSRLRYVPEIVAFVEGIVKNGFAYESEGSIYFDTEAFDNSPEYDYARLEPWSKGNRELLEDGEASRPGEPSWPSPWGPGRPGWYIECSVMASAILGIFPNFATPHSRKLLSLDFIRPTTDVAHGSNYFIHTGHLHVEGLKMSKSLKNFITIGEILQKYTARQLRLAFLTQLWSAKVDFTESLMTGEVRSLETTINNFFTNVSALLSQASADGTKSDGYHHYEEPERELRIALYESQYAFRVALCDSFNTPAALGVVRDLIARTNVYITSRGKGLNLYLLENVARWTGQMLRMFGLGEGSPEELGWGTDGSSAGGVNREEVLMPYIRSLSTFRDSVRRLAMGKGDTALQDILALCDRLRDVDLVPLDGKALVKLIPPAELIPKLEKGRVAPQDMFRPPNVPEGTYGSWNEMASPLTDAEGKELCKNQGKKAAKDWAAQTKLHDEWLAYQKEAKE
ncbi:tRNA synthetases class I (C) catalytic domain-containing protein [Mycena olivaceomarginata]|nr:tRNA synthetases class I (C) catalytic domain-containing protein [Mycena olivaceomarginata]